MITLDQSKAPKIEQKTEEIQGSLPPLSKCLISSSSTTLSISLSLSPLTCRLDTRTHDAEELPALPVCLLTWIVARLLAELAVELIPHLRVWVHQREDLEDLLGDLDLLAVHVRANVLPDEGGLLGEVVAEGEDQWGGELLFGELQRTLQLILRQRLLLTREVRLRKREMRERKRERRRCLQDE